MIKLTEILQDILAEKKLCPKGRAYYNRRRAAGEKPSAYLSGRAVKVCKGLMEGDEETVECAKCGWRWDLENGGKNPYLCHKCDYDNSYKYNDNLDEGFAHQMSNSDFDKMTNILNNKSKADQIHSLLIQMFPNQKELLDYNYKNDSYAEFKRFIHGIENYSLEGPINIPYTDLKLDPEVYAERDRKYNDYVEGKINKYFRDTNLDPRKVDLSKVPPITVDENGEVMDGNHRAFLAIKQQKPLKGYRMVAKQNSHPNVAKIKALLNTIDESLRDWFKKEDDLEEAKQAGILYHWTSLKNLEDIIKTNTIRPAYSEFDDEDNGVSLTRSKNKHQFGISEAADCVIVLDGDKLSNNYKIKPYNDLEVAQYDDFGIFDEMEERLLGSIKNLNKYIVKIILYKSDPKIESLLKEKNIPYELNLNESLRDWFKKEDWVRIDTAGNITGPCGTMKKGNKTTRCLPRAKANSLTKAERAATSKKKAASDKQFVPNTKKAKVRLNK